MVTDGEEYKKRLICIFFQSKMEWQRLKFGTGPEKSGFAGGDSFTMSNASRGGGKRASSIEMGQITTVFHNNFINDRKSDEWDSHPGPWVSTAATPKVKSSTIKAIRRCPKLDVFLRLFHIMYFLHRLHHICNFQKKKTAEWTYFLAMSYSVGNERPWIIFWSWEWMNEWMWGFALEAYRTHFSNQDLWLLQRNDRPAGDFSPSWAR